MIKFKSLDKKLAAILMTIALVTTLATTLASLYTARQLFSGYLAKSGSMQVHNWAAAFASYYQQHHSFSGIENEALPVMGRGRGYGRMMGGGLGGSNCIVLAGLDGTVIWDSTGTLAGQKLSQEQLQAATPVEADKKAVAYVAAVNSHAYLGSLENDFVNSLTLYSLIIGLLIGLASLWIGTRLARPIIRPIQILSQATHRLASGELDTKVEILGDKEIEQLAEDFNQMAESLRRTQTMRRNLTADIAHELRTPLTILRTNLESLQSGKALHAEETLASLNDEVIRMGKLVKDMETLALAETGNLVLNKKPLHVNTLLERLQPVFWDVKDKGIELQINMDEGLPPVDMDGDRILQVLLNLLSNAIAHSTAGGRIVIGGAKNLDSIRLSVADQGEGINQEQLPYIFERFYRADGARSRREGGMGLGLAIAKSLVEAHGGRIWAESPPGQGTTFIFTLPTQ